MKLLKCVQYSPEWFEARAGMPTASELHNLITPEWKPKTGETPATYLAAKCAEKWIGGALPGFTSFATEFGNIVEEQAIPWFALEYDVDIKRGAFITTDDGKFGCSPDGLIEGRETGLEIKCPQPPAHFKYLIEGELPKQYAAQVHGSMYATGYAEWIFLSYRELSPNLVIKVKRDEAIIKKIDAVVRDFNERLDEAFAKLKRMP